jgi:hypothetical protein
MVRFRACCTPDGPQSSVSSPGTSTSRQGLHRLRGRSVAGLEQEESGRVSCASRRSHLTKPGADRSRGSPCRSGREPVPLRASIAELPRRAPAALSRSRVVQGEGLRSSEGNGRTSAVGTRSVAGDRPQPPVHRGQTPRSPSGCSSAERTRADREAPAWRRARVRRSCHAVA